MNNRVFFKGTVLQDISPRVAKYTEGSVTLEFTDESFLYIGARLPFNHLYFDCSKPALGEEETLQVLSPKIEYWNGSHWIEVVDIIDQTNGLAQSGHIEFTPNKAESWVKWDTNYEGTVIPELQSVTVYDKYWLRLSYDETMTQDPTITFIGNLFSNDHDLSVEYPDLVRANVLSSFEANKTDWREQHLRSAELIIKDLIDIGVIKEKGQVLNWRDYTDAAIHKVAEIAFNSFGDSYVDNSVAARREYQDRLSKRVHRVDLNRNAIEQPFESLNTTGWMTR